VYICFVDDVLQMYEFALKYMPFCLKWCTTLEFTVHH